MKRGVKILTIETKSLSVFSRDSKLNNFSYVTIVLLALLIKFQPAPSAYRRGAVNFTKTPV